MGENKQDIVSKLSTLLKATRAGSGIDKLELTADEKEVRITFKSGFGKSVNVAGDSGIALIKDVISRL